MKLTKEGILKQLGYNEEDLKRLEEVIKHTTGFDKIMNHLVALNDKLKHTNSFVGFSNSVPHMKIKIESLSNELKEEAEEIIKKWAEKYNVVLEKVKEGVYYIKKVI